MVKEKKILFITSRSDIGGGPKHLASLLSSSPYKDVAKFVAAPKEGYFSPYFKQYSSQFLPIPHRKFSISSFLKILFFCREQNIHIIHSHGRGAGVYSRLLGLFGFSIVHTFHGVHNEQSLIGKIKLFIDKLLAQTPTKYICVSQSEKVSALNHSLCRQAKVIFNGVDLPELPSSNHQTDLIKVGLLCRLNYQKGIDVLIDFLKVSNFPDNIQFLVAGDGELKDELSEQAFDIHNLKFLGQTENPESFLQSIDIFLSTSRWEGFPLSVLEAMANKKPCLLSNTTGHEFFLENDIAKGFKLDDYQDFRKKLITVIENSKETYQMSEKAYDFLKRNLTVDAMAKNTYDFTFDKSLE